MHLNKGKMKRLIIIIFFTTFSVVVFGQNERKHVRSGNKLFLDAVKDTTKIDTVKFSNAETEYRISISPMPFISKSVLMRQQENLPNWVKK